MYGGKERKLVAQLLKDSNSPEHEWPGTLFYIA